MHRDTLIAVIASVAIHLLLLGVLLFSFSRPPQVASMPEQPEIIQATVLGDFSVPVDSERLRKEQEQQRLVEEEQRQIEETQRLLQQKEEQRQAEMVARAEREEEILSPRPDFSAAAMTMVVGLVGTTIAPWMQFYLQASIVDKGLTAKDYKIIRWDVITGSVTVSVTAFFIILVCAVTIHASGMHIEKGKEAALALAPLARKICL